MIRRSVWMVVFVLLLVAPAGPFAAPINAQGGEGDLCLEIVEEALATVEESCAGLGRNDACYGYNR